MKKTTGERVSVVSRWNEEARQHEWVVLYDAPNSRKPREVAVYDEDQAVAAYNFRNGYVAGLDDTIAKMN